MLVTTDNNRGIAIENQFLADLEIIGNRTISSLVSDSNQNLMVFPGDFIHNGDQIGEESIFTLKDDILTTGNIMGFIGINDSEITIKSRFAHDMHDYFLHYMLQKVFSINLFDLKHGLNNESIFDFLLYLFPFYLKRALRQGLYKEYQSRDYNDSNVRGKIDIGRHLRSNMPFNGNVACKVREHSYDNNLTQLVRHTIEYIRQHRFARGILDNDTETQTCVREMVQATSGYRQRDRISVIYKNMKPFSHPYFVEYAELKKICIQILRYEGLKYGYEKNKVYGLLFDGAWLWEEYLNTLMVHCGFRHPRNKTGEGAIYLFSKSKGRRFPDFWKENFIVDAKYKRLANMDANGIDRHDINQIISYMHVKQAETGGFVVPADNPSIQPLQSHLGHLNGYGGDVYVWALPIPQKEEDFGTFCQKMKENEKGLVELIKIF